MVSRTTLKVGAVVVGVALLFVLVRTLLGWLFQLAMLLGVALLVVAVAYLAYRVLTDPGERERATTAGADASAEPGPGDELIGTDDAVGSDADAGLSDDEFEREIEKLREDS